MSWPRLSEDLPFARELDTCQSCGQSHATMGTWQEHDDNDGPEMIFVVLCDRCSAAIVEPHRRLYRLLDVGESAPGAMPCCIGCRHQGQLRCGHPGMIFNGGPGVAVRATIVSRGFLCSRGRGGHGCQPVTRYKEEPTCDGKESS